jgi:hypothetical protein
MAKLSNYGVFIAGVCFAACSTLFLGITPWKQSRNMAMRDVDAPPFETLDLYGKTQRLQDPKGELVLVHI